MAARKSRVDQVCETAKRAVDISSPQYQGAMLTEIALSLAMIADIIVEKMIREEGSEPDVRG